MTTFNKDTIQMTTRQEYETDHPDWEFPSESRLDKFFESPSKKTLYLVNLKNSGDEDSLYVLMSETDDRWLFQKANSVVSKFFIPELEEVYLIDEDNDGAKDLVIVGAEHMVVVRGEFTDEERVARASDPSLSESERYRMLEGIQDPQLADATRLQLLTAPDAPCIDYLAFPQIDRMNDPLNQQRAYLRLFENQRCGSYVREQALQYINDGIIEAEGITPEDVKRALIRDRERFSAHSRFEMAKSLGDNEGLTWIAHDPMVPGEYRLKAADLLATPDQRQTAYRVIATDRGCDIGAITAAIQKLEDKSGLEQVYHDIATNPDHPDEIQWEYAAKLPDAMKITAYQEMIKEPGFGYLRGAIDYLRKAGVGEHLDDMLVAIAAKGSGRGKYERIHAADLVVDEKRRNVAFEHIAMDQSIEHDIVDVCDRVRAARNITDIKSRDRVLLSMADEYRKAPADVLSILEAVSPDSADQVLSRATNLLDSDLPQNVQDRAQTLMSHATRLEGVEDGVCF